MRTIIIRKLNQLETTINQLRKLQKYSFDEVKDDLEKLWAIEHGLQIAIQIIIDIGNHMIAEIGENEIDKYTDIFDKLVKHDIIPSEFAINIKGMIGFRNLLVHRYGEVNVEVVYDILQNRLYDFERFVGYVQSHI